MATDGWYPPALDDHAPDDGGSHTGPVTVGVLHTTESTRFIPNGRNYFGHTSYPHFTVAVVTIGGKRTFRVWQHISIRRSARALKNLSGGVQTNREGVIQIEVVGTATDPFTDDAVMVEGLRALMRWVEKETQIGRRSSVTFRPYPASYGQRAAQRLSYDRWRGYVGWLGHQHVPENDHGDPGDIDIDLLLDGDENTPPPLIELLKEDPMKIVHAPGKATCVQLATGRFVALQAGEVEALKAIGTPVEGVTADQWDTLDRLSKRL